MESSNGIETASNLSEFWRFLTPGWDRDSNVPFFLHFFLHFLLDSHNILRFISRLVQYIVEGGWESISVNEDTTQRRVKWDFRRFKGWRKGWESRHLGWKRRILSSLFKGKRTISTAMARAESHIVKNTGACGEKTVCLWMVMKNQNR